MTCHPEIDALAAAGQRIYCWGRPSTRYPAKTPETPAKELYGVLGRKYANDVFCGNKHIQIIGFSFLAHRPRWNSFKHSINYGGLPNRQGG
jgi:hypothetical protein